MASPPPPPYYAAGTDKGNPYYDKGGNNGPSPYPPGTQGGYQPPYPQGYPPPQAGYTTDHQNTNVIVTQPQVTVIQTFGPDPLHMTCPHCRAEIVTSTNFETGTFSWLICVILCLVGCNLGCCLIPFCVEGCQDVVHTCPNCRQQLSRYKRM